MLRNFRAVFKGSQTPMTVVMGIVLVGLVAYLAPGQSGPESSSSVIARVYGRDILRQDSDKYVRQMIERMGRKQTDLDKILPFLQERALQELIITKLREELADRHGIVVTDQELADEMASQMKHSPMFVNPDGTFKPVSEINQYLLETQGISLKDIERDIHRMLLVSKLHANEAAKVQVDEAWMNLENRVQNEKITYEVATLAPNVAAVADPGDAKLQAFLKEGGARFQVGPRRVIQFVMVDKASLGDALKLDDATLKAAYESKKSAFSEYKPVHILFKASNDAEAAAASVKALELRKELQSGKKDFLKTAEAISEDPSAKMNKGDMGWTKSGMMVKPFEDASLAMKEGEISQPVRTQFGVHLIRLDGKRVKPFEEVKEELRSQMSQDRFASKAKEKLEQLRKRAGEKGDLAAAAKNLGLNCQVSAPFLEEPAAEIKGIKSPGTIIQDAFNLEIGQVSKVHNVMDGYVVIRPKEEKAPSVPSLAEIRTKVLDAWRQEEARKVVKAKAEAARAAGDPKLLADIKTEENRTIASLADLGRNSAIRKALLETPEGKLTPALWTPEGHVWVARIKSRTAPEALTFEKRQKLVLDLQKQVSEKLLEAELSSLYQQGQMRPGFNSLWGRMDGIWVNPSTKRTKDEE